MTADGEAQQIMNEISKAGHHMWKCDGLFEDGLRQAEQDITKEKERADKLLTSLILSYHAQNKSPEEIAALCEQSIDFVLDVLKKHNL